MNISFDSEVPFQPYTVDIYIAEWHLGIEVDGPFHSKKKDESRDKWLEVHYGLRILRIDVKIWRTKKYIENKILEFLDEFAESTQERKQILWAR